MTRKILVCAACLTACCRDGVFRCDRAGEAGVVDKPVDELERLGREHPDYWEEKPYIDETRPWPC